MTRLNLFLFVLFISVFSCSRSGEPVNQEKEFFREQSFSKEKTEVKYARGFEITYHSNYKALNILNPYQDRTDTLHYVLVPRGAEPPQSAINAQVIELPVRSIIVTSTTHLALTDMLDANQIVVGVSQPEYVYSKEIRNRLEQGKIVSFNGGEFNTELALAMEPDLIVVSGGQASQIDQFRILIRSGINVLVNSEWLETTPLGKAEWVKMMAALLNKEAMANRKFSEVEQKYLKLKQQVRNVDEKPLVINNVSYKGAWFVSGGNSFTAQYLKDAGADYPWFDNSSTGGLRMEFEAVYVTGLRADVWLNPGSATSKEDLLARDTRLKDFKSFQTGRVYNNNKRLSPSGGNDFWESGVVHPEIVLADLIKIFHPPVLPGHELYYYQKLE